MPTVVTWTNIEHKQKFESLYAEATMMKGGEDLHLVKTFWDMMDVLKLADHAYECRVPPLNMGIHFKNRGGKKMMGVSMHTKGSKVYGVGFKQHLCSKLRAVGMEKNPQRDNCETWTIVTCNTDPYFATYSPGTIRAGSLGCSHLNQWLAAVVAGAKTPTPNPKCCKPGTDVLCKGIIEQQSSELKDALNDGLTWTLIKWAIEDAYPKFPEICQRALNVEHHVGEGR